MKLSRSSCIAAIISLSIVSATVWCAQPPQEPTASQSDTPLWCLQCPTWFTTTQGYARHMERFGKHERCAHCTRTVRISEKETHQVPCKQKRTCPTCKKVSSTKGNCLRHKKVCKERLSQEVKLPKQQRTDTAHSHMRTSVFQKDAFLLIALAQQQPLLLDDYASKQSQSSSEGVTRPQKRQRTSN